MASVNVLSELLNPEAGDVDLTRLRKLCQYGTCNYCSLFSDLFYLKELLMNHHGFALGFGGECYLN